MREETVSTLLNSITTQGSSQLLTQKNYTTSSIRKIRRRATNITMRTLMYVKKMMHTANKLNDKYIVISPCIGAKRVRDLLCTSTGVLEKHSKESPNLKHSIKKWKGSYYKLLFNKTTKDYNSVLLSCQV